MIKESVIYAIINIIGSFLTIILIFLIQLFTEGVFLSFKDLAKGGSMIIICIPLCVTVLYCLYTGKAKKGISGWAAFFFWVTLLLIIVGSVLFSIFTLGFKQYDSGVYSMSIIMIIWTVLSLSYSKYYESLGYDARSKRQKDGELLEEKVEHLNR